jgi:hypothetical protein
MNVDINREVLEINTNDKMFFSEYLTLKKPVLEIILKIINKKDIVLNPKMLHVFALLLYYNNKYRDMDDSIKWDLVFGNDARLDITKEVNINRGQLNTYISRLRNVHLLTGKQISLPFIFYPKTGFELTFKFIINEE